MSEITDFEMGELEYALEEEIPFAFNEGRIDVSKNPSYEELELLDSILVEDEVEEGSLNELRGEISRHDVHQYEDESFLGEGENAVLYQDEEIEDEEIFLDKSAPLLDLQPVESSFKLKEKSSRVIIMPEEITPREPPLVTRMKPRTCVKDRMRKWLNRNRNELPNESFLGIKYANIEKTEESVAKVCQKLVCASLDNIDVQAGEEGDDVDEPDKEQKINHMCACQSEPIPPTASKHSAIGTEYLSDAEINLQGTEFVVSPLKPCECNKQMKSIPCQIQSRFRKHRKKREFHVRRSRSRPRYRDKIKSCNCLKKVWTYSKHHGLRLKNKKCTCHRLKHRRRRFLSSIKRKYILQLESHLAEMEEKMKNEKIEALLRMIDPEFASRLRKLAAENNTETTRAKPNSFVRMIRSKFGGQLRKYRVENLKNGIVRGGYNEDEPLSFQYVEMPNGSAYYGQFSPLGMEGLCVYKMAHGPIFWGTMIDGKMEGPGRLSYPNGGIVDGIWVSGTLFSPHYTFSDGLEFKSKGWKYCQMPDRRFFSEIVNGMNSPDNVQLCADHPARQIPDGCLDAGQGFYDPKKKAIIHPSTGKIVRIVTEPEGDWIIRNCRREQFEEVPFSRYMYENWYAGTVLPPPNDEPEWFDNEFLKVILPYSNINDVLEARRMAMNTDLEEKL